MKHLNEVLFIYLVLINIFSLHILENGDVIDAREREILELRSRLNELMASYDEIVSNKSSLEFEINTYRRLLESEEAHVKKVNDSSSSFKQTTKTTTIIKEREYTPPPPPQPKPVINNFIDTKINQTEMQAKTTFQRSAKGLFSSSFFLIFILY